MNTFKGFEILKYYETEIDAVKQELNELPAGILVKRGAFYYVKDGSSEKGITKDQQRIRQLARKAYLYRRMGNLKWNYSLASKQSQRLRTEDPKEIIEGLSSAYQSMPEDFFFHSSVQQSLEKPVVSNPGYRDGLLYLTDSGVRVRSKSERIVANMLSQYKIPYRYEAALTLAGEVRYPDFSVYRPFDGRLILWEHLGLMESEEYRQKAIRKLALYAQNGFLPFDNLICT